MDTLIEIKLEKHKNLWEESRFFWGEIEDGTLKFDRAQVEVCYLGPRVISEELLERIFLAWLALAASVASCWS